MMKMILIMTTIMPARGPFLVQLDFLDDHDRDAGDEDDDVEEEKEGDDHDHDVGFG